MGDDIEQRLRQVIVQQLTYPLNPAEIGEGTSLYGKGIAFDSLDVVSLITRIEDEFDIMVEAEELPAIVATFGTLRDAVQRKMRGR